jgi:hypothetical protein
MQWNRWGHRLRPIKPRGRARWMQWNRRGHRLCPIDGQIVSVGGNTAGRRYRWSGRSREGRHNKSRKSNSKHTCSESSIHRDLLNFLSCVDPWVAKKVEEERRNGGGERFLLGIRSENPGIVRGIRSSDEVTRNRHDQRAGRIGRNERQAICGEKSAAGEPSKGQLLSWKRCGSYGYAALMFVCHSRLKK